MIKADLAVLNCNQLVTCQGSIPKRKEDLQDIGLLENGCIASFNGEIVFVGDEEAYNREVELTDGGIRIDGRGQIGLPGFVDPHTHLVFSGAREFELDMKLKGLTYMDILKKGGGIVYTVSQTRKAKQDELINQGRIRLNNMLMHGTTTCEAKSGYGLDTETELKILKTQKKLNETHPIDIVSTFLGAHAVPKEHSTNDYLSNKNVPN